MKTILVVAGEASGDLHGSEILKAIKLLRPDVRLVGVGGSLMTSLLDRKLADVSELSVMGFVEVIGHLPKLKRLFDSVLAAAIDEDIDGALLIDYPGFNIRLAKALKRATPMARLHQFVCPQVWAWKASRIPKLGNIFDVIYCLFDFEPKLFAGYPVEAIWTGNPIVETTLSEVSRDVFFASSGLDPNRPLVALLPGSRIDEIKRLMPPLVELVESWQLTQEWCAIQWVIPVAPTIKNSDFMPYIKNTNIKLVNGLSYAARAYANAALVCSGTATLETALLGTPFIAFYKLNKLTYLIAKRLVKIPYFSLANIVAGYGMVPELLQGDVSASRLGAELSRILDSNVGVHIRFELSKIRNRLGEPGAANRVARHLLNSICHSS
jgi:lipid-A-disaccharide synthase